MSSILRTESSPPDLHDTAALRTGAISPSNTAPVHVQRSPLVPSTPGIHQRVHSAPRTPGSSTYTCSSMLSAFTFVTVHTAKCSECDQRNKGTMLRCPGCTFQVCEPCQEGRERKGRSLAHGNMPSAQFATPETAGCVMRKKPVGTVRSVVKEVKGQGDEVGDVETMVQEARVIGESKGKQNQVKSTPKRKARAKSRARPATPSSESSGDEFMPDTASPSANKRSRICTDKRLETACDDRPPFLKSTDNAQAPERLHIGASKLTERPLSAMTTDEILAYHDVNTPANPYQSHLLSRHEPVVTNPIIRIPEVVKRGFKPRTSAEKMQMSIQDKVRQKMGLLRSRAGTTSSG